METMHYIGLDVHKRTISYRERWQRHDISGVSGEF